ncbi:MAG: AraC family transcriptional regulator, partial [Phototrophicales bacterium]
VYISLDTKLMAELVLELQSTLGMKYEEKTCTQGLSTSSWDKDFSDALMRLLALSDSPHDRAVLGKSRLRELYYAILKGEAGESFIRAFGVNNHIARSIEYLSSRISEPVTIDDMANFANMSRATFHRKFKQATNMSPIQFVKSMRLNYAAMKISQGVNVNIAAMEVGYTSSSQFSREFKRMYGHSPKQWAKVVA